MQRNKSTSPARLYSIFLFFVGLVSPSSLRSRSSPLPSSCSPSMSMGVAFASSSFFTSPALAPASALESFVGTEPTSVVGGFFFGKGLGRLRTCFFTLMFSSSCSYKNISETRVGANSSRLLWCDRAQRFSLHASHLHEHTQEYIDTSLQLYSRSALEVPVESKRWRLLRQVAVVRVW